MSKTINAQDPISFQITEENGLPNQTIYSIKQDTKGFIWIGTDAGLYKYDGVRFVEYKNLHQKSRSVTGLTQSSDNRVYMFNFSGQIFFIENDSLNYLSTWDKGSISSIAVDTSGNLWVTYGNGIQQYNSRDKTWKQFKSNPIYIGYTHSCFVDSSNVFWAIGPQGLISIKDEIGECFPVNWLNNKVSGEYLLAQLSKEKFIFSRIGGEVFVLKTNKLVRFYSKNLNSLLIDKKITFLEEDNERKLWIYTYSGVIVYDIEKDKSDWIHIDKGFSSSIRDDEKTIWLATLDDGLIKIPEYSFKFWQLKTPEYELSKINRLACKDKYIVAGTSDGKIGLLSLEDKKTKISSLKTKLDIQHVAFSEIDNSVYISVQNTIYRLIDDKLKEVVSGFPPTKDISEFDNKLIIATSKGSFLINPKSIKDHQELNDKWSRAIKTNHSLNKAYIATNNGIDVFNTEYVVWKKETTLIPETQILSISLASEKEIYALTFNGNIYAIDTLNHIKLMFSFPEGITAYQVKTDNRNIYCSSNKGLWIITKSGKVLNVINHLSGLHSDIVNSFDIFNERIWIATKKGVQEIPINIVPKKCLPRIYLKKNFAQDNLNIRNNIVLRHNEAYKVAIEALSFASEDKYQFAYRINKQNWMYLPSKITQIDFPSINVGKFIIEIKLVNHLGNESINRIILTGRVQPPFWQAWWFYIIIIIVFIAVAVVAFKKRIQFIEERQKKELERINLEHQLKLSQETALRAQMNPHFIFNVLNSIKSYTYENDKKKAISYLQRFSDLIRKILEQSSVLWVNLEEEIKFLKLYIELESMLFSDDFEYSFQIEDNIDVYHSRIPSLILQPFIENAFKHGLRHKEGKKHIIVDFKLEQENTLIVTITDNGIGREKSSIINQSKQNKHKSFSTQAINRVSILNKNTPGTISIFYRDLVDDVGEGAGTSVEIKINVNE